MRIVIQRVLSAGVRVDENIIGKIEKGLLILVGFTHEDTEKEVSWMVKKVLNLRIFSDLEGKMNLSIQDVQGELLIVSQFTLYSDCKKGNRPSFIRSAPPSIAIPLYETFIDSLQKNIACKVATGKFGANMEITLINDGPVTIILDSTQPDW